MKNKRGIFFSTDAFIAVMIIFLTVLVIYPTIEYTEKKDYTQSDLTKVLSSIKIGEVDDQYAKTLIAQGMIPDLNKTLLEQIGEFYAENITLARELTNSLLYDLDIQGNTAVYINEDLIYIKNSSSLESAKNIKVDRQIISGIKQGEDVKGYSARAFLSNQMQTKYYYFGGYLGEGNISINVNYTGNLTNIELEIAINKDFDVYINNIFSGHFTNSSSEFTPKNYDDIDAYLNNFHSGNNIIKIAGNDSHIAGGYFKIIYSNSSSYETPVRYHFPGVEGLLNVYDGFYIPGNLNQMNIFLHMKTNLSSFLNIGNTTVFRNSTSAAEKNYSLNNSYLFSILNYSKLSNQTVPIRFGTDNISYIIRGRKDVDVFSVNDISGSMCGTCDRSSRVCGACCGFLCLGCIFGGDNDQWACEKCGPLNGRCTGGVHEVNNATKVFIDSILNNTNNRVGLVAYSNSVLTSNINNLTNNNATLKSKVDSWNATGSTCICCGINIARDYLGNYSNSTKSRAMVVMSDGEANVQCTRQGTGNSKNDAIQAACQAYQLYGIKVYAIGFGPDTDNTTLQAIAACGNGSFFYGNASQIGEVYQQVADRVIEGAYSEQTVVGATQQNMTLYPDSYIEFGYSTPQLPYGVIVTSQKPFTNETFGNFNLPSNSSIIETRVVSYSGPRWTQYININGASAYNLTKYISNSTPNYTQLGDPYAINIPNSLITNSNNITLTTGLSPANSSIGSLSNKIIYTVAKNMTSFSSIKSNANGCKWNVEFEDNTMMNFSVPKDYSGTNLCYYTTASQELGDANDAINVAVYNLLKLLDLNSNEKIDVMITNQSLEISSSQVTGIPYTTDFSEVKIIRWD